MVLLQVCVCVDEVIMKNCLGEYKEVFLSVFFFFFTVSTVGWLQVMSGVSASPCVCMCTVNTRLISPESIFWTSPPPLPHLPSYSPILHPPPHTTPTFERNIESISALCSIQTAHFWLLKSHLYCSWKQRLFFLCACFFCFVFVKCEYALTERDENKEERKETVNNI